MPRHVNCTSLGRSVYAADQPEGQRRQLQLDAVNSVLLLAFFYYKYGPANVRPGIRPVPVWQPGSSSFYPLPFYGKKKLQLKSTVVDDPGIEKTALT
jgi:hypothetical protein